MKTYTNTLLRHSFIDRFDYLNLHGKVGEETFAHARYLNQEFYKSNEWLWTRDQVILRDDGCDLAHPDYPIAGRIYIHHIDPITVEDILNRTPKLLDLDNLICTSFNTHQAIHYGDINLLIIEPIQRTRGDTDLW